MITLLWFPICLVYRSMKSVSVGDRSDRGHLCCVWRNHCPQHGRSVTGTILVCHIFLDPCGCKFFLLKLFFFLVKNDNSNIIHHRTYLITLCVIFNPLQCFPSAIASHVVSEYPNKCLVSTRQYYSCWSTERHQQVSDVFLVSGF